MFFVILSILLFFACILRKKSKIVSFDIHFHCNKQFLGKAHEISLMVIVKAANKLFIYLFILLVDTSQFGLLKNRISLAYVWL